MVEIDSVSIPWLTSWMPATRELLLMIDGPHARPATVEDPLSFLRVATSWFNLAGRVADAMGRKVRFRGLHVRDKCVAFASVPSNVRNARAVADSVARIVAGSEDPPSGADGVTEELRGSIRMLDGHAVSIRIGSWTRPIAPPAPGGPTDRWERTELRVQPIRVGGTKITAKLASRSERVAFTVDVKEEADARLLGANLYRDIDVELRLCRGSDDVVKGGLLLAVHTLGEKDAAASWRTWFKENAGEWDDVDNILVELGRGH